MIDRDELVMRLRNPLGTGIAPTLWLNRAADQIERDGQEIARLRDALTFYADAGKYVAPLTGGQGDLYFDCGARARAALNWENKK